METTHRLATPDDYEALCQLISHPAIRAWQNGPVTPESLQAMKRRLEGDNRVGPYLAYSHVITLPTGEIIGSIDYGSYRVGQGKGYYCGWDLHPDYWGQGIMSSTLRSLYQEWFADEQLLLILSECDHDNERCIRLMERLGYQQTFVGAREQLRHIWHTRRWKWKWFRRFYLTRAMWSQAHPSNERDHLLQLHSPDSHAADGDA